MFFISLFFNKLTIDKKIFEGGLENNRKEMEVSVSIVYSESRKKPFLSA
jgi:hypothetical protein